MPTVPAGTAVVIRSEGSVFNGLIGKVSKKQDEVAGVWVDLQVVPGGEERRLWFPSAEVKIVTT